MFSLGRLCRPFGGGCNNTTIVFLVAHERLPKGMGQGISEAAFCVYSPMKRQGKQSLFEPLMPCLGYSLLMGM